MGVFYYRRLLDGYQIAWRIDPVTGLRQYYVQRLTEAGVWEDVRGPFRQTGSASAWLDRKRLREVLAAKKRGDTIIYPPGHPRHDSNGISPDAEGNYPEPPDRPVG
jgi:hypothetical protein